jgi:hypothetical protein
MHRGGSVGMRGKFVKFGSSLMRIARHNFVVAQAFLPVFRVSADLALSSKKHTHECLCYNLRGRYAVRIASDLSPEIAACAAASLAIGTRYGEQET